MNFRDFRVFVFGYRAQNGNSEITENLYFKVFFSNFVKFAFVFVFLYFWLVEFVIPLYNCFFRDFRGFSDFRVVDLAKEFDPEIEWFVVCIFKCWYAVKYCKRKPVIFQFCTSVTSGLIYRLNLHTVSSFTCVAGHFWTGFLLSLTNRMSAACIVCI